MNWNKHLTDLRNILAGLYWDKTDARRVAVEAGINPIRLRLSDQADITWQSILEEANHQQRVGNIIDIAYNAYPNIQGLQMAAGGELAQLKTPPTLKQHEWQGTTDQGQLEAILGQENTMLPINYLEQGVKYARSVGRVVMPHGGNGTGFLLADNWLITNHHVLPNVATAADASVQFNYQQMDDGLNAPISTYRFAPNDGFITSPKQGGDDWTAVKVNTTSEEEGKPIEQWGNISLLPVYPKVGNRATIIQHPSGGQKQIGLHHNVVMSVSERRIQYLTDTLEGSSGSPVFNNQWQVIAVHHSGNVPEPNAKVNRYRNQGVHVNVIVEGLAKEGVIT
ncbi:MAG: serine protease [Chloroflexota bacterium]